MRSQTRRAFLRNASIAAATAALSPQLLAQVEHQLGAEEANSPTKGLSADIPQIRVLLTEPDGSPLDADRAKTLTVRDMAGDPLPQTVVTASGRCRIALAKEPIQLTMRLKIPNFGEVYCYADNNGRGYSKKPEGNIEFVLDAAHTRLLRVRKALEGARAAGTPIERAIDDHLQAASVFDRADYNGPGAIRAAYESLSHSVPAGEMLTLAIARHRIAKLSAPRKDFKFGVMISAHDSSPEYNKIVVDAFNFATISWYWWQAENPPEQRINYTRMDNSYNFCVAHKIEPKTFGYTYMTRGATPEWLRPPEAATRPGAPSTVGGIFNERWPYKKLLELYKHVNEQTARRYHGKIKYIEVINEAHDKANLWRLSQQQILEMTRESLAASRRGSSTIQRQINHCCLWAEYAKTTNADGSRRWSPYRYLKDVLASGGQFEVLGLQLYYPQFDLFEIDRMLDRFKDFNRPCHITEVATASIDGLDPKSMRPNTAAPGWHGPWSQETQADWLEGVYTLCYSKPHFETVGWWDLTDKLGHFWPHGGLVDTEMKPKLAYQRLLDLQKKWGVGPKGQLAT